MVKRQKSLHIDFIYFIIFIFYFEMGIRWYTHENEKQTYLSLEIFEKKFFFWNAFQVQEETSQTGL